MFKRVNYKLWNSTFWVVIKSNMKKSKRTTTVGHILITFWIPLCTYYILFWSLGSQESNSSNGVQIGVEMKKLWPFEDNCTKLKDNFASCEITKFNLRNQPFLAKWTLSACENFASHVPTCEIHLCAPRYLWPTLLNFFLHIFVV